MLEARSLGAQDASGEPCSSSEPATGSISKLSLHAAAPACAEEEEQALAAEERGWRGATQQSRGEQAGTAPQRSPMRAALLCWDADSEAAAARADEAAGLICACTLCLNLHFTGALSGQHALLSHLNQSAQDFLLRFSTHAGNHRAEKPPAPPAQSRLSRLSTLLSWLTS